MNELQPKSYSEARRLVCQLGDKKHPVATVEVETSKFTHLGKARGADVYFFKYADHDCFMVSVGNGVSVHCPK